MVSASALTTFETIAIGHAALQDTLLEVAVAPLTCRSMAGAGEKPTTVLMVVEMAEPWGVPGYSPRFIMYFNKSATRWL